MTSIKLLVAATLAAKRSSGAEDTAKLLNQLAYLLERGCSLSVFEDDPEALKLSVDFEAMLKA
jgi:hypothetical protein